MALAACAQWRRCLWLLKEVDLVSAGSLLRARQQAQELWRPRVLALEEQEMVAAMTLQARFGLSSLILREVERGRDGGGLDLEQLFF